MERVNAIVAELCHFVLIISAFSRLVFGASACFFAFESAQGRTRTLFLLADRGDTYHYATWIEDGFMFEEL